METILAPGAAEIEYCGELFRPDPDRPFSIGRSADLSVDENPFLHRRLLEVVHYDGLWWLSNTGSRISATATWAGGRAKAVLAPGARMPVVAGETVITFSGAATTYELAIRVASPVAEVWHADTAAMPAPSLDDPDVTVGQATLTHAQRKLVVALAEPLLRHSGVAITAIPSNAAAAARLGWPLSTFNRHLDRACQRLTAAGVTGLYAGRADGAGDRAPGPATNRRARLVEYALSADLVSARDLSLLDHPSSDDRK